MTLSDLGAIGELVGAVATVVTLGYLAVQIRQHTNATRAATYDAILAGWRQHQRESFIAHPENVELWARGLTDFNALSPPHQRTFIFMGATEAHFVENLLQQRDRGNLSADEIEVWVAYFTSVVRTPGGAVWWDVNKKLFRANLVAEIDRRVQSSGDAPHLLQLIPQLRVQAGS